MVSKTETFKKNYEKLKSIANELKNNPDIDIDALVSKVKEGVACQKVCKARMEAATKELDSVLQETNQETNIDISIAPKED